MATGLFRVGPVGLEPTTYGLTVRLRSPEYHQVRVLRAYRNMG